MDQMNFQQALDASCETVWPYITYPEKMNLWSEARITVVEEAEPGRPDSVGTVRRVVVPSPIIATRLTERVIFSEPPGRFGYHVIHGGGLRKHEGTITLRPTDTGCELAWIVDFEPWIPFTGWISKAIVEPAMRRSLRKLASVVETVAPQPSTAS